MNILTPPRLVPVLLVAAAGTGALTTSAAADKILLSSSTPRSGATVKKLPASVLLTFNAKPVKAKVEITSADGDNHATSTKLSDRDVIVRTRGNEHGRLKVSYTVYDKDGDARSGSFLFTVR